MSKEEAASYYKFNFESAQSELLIAMLNQLAFNGFEVHNDKSFSAYADSKDVDDTFIATLDSFKKSIPFEHSQEVLEMQNWNAVWEEDFEPVIVRFWLWHRYFSDSCIKNGCKRHFRRRY